MDNEIKYRRLLDSLDQGFFIIDVIFDENNQPVDGYFVEVNAAAINMLGRDFTGKRLKEMDFNHKGYCLESFGQVALTGKSIRTEQYIESDKRWHSVYLYKIGDENSRRIGNIFLDITERKRNEANQEFLYELSRELVGLDDIAETFDYLSERIGRYLGASWCMFGEPSNDFTSFILPYGWSAPGMNSLKGRYEVQEYFLDQGLASYLSGEISDTSLIVTDAQNDSRVNSHAFGRLGIGSCIIVSVTGNSQWKFQIAIANNKPRQWRRDEIDLVQEITDWIWFRLDYARRDGIRKSEERKTFLLRFHDALRLLTDPMEIQNEAVGILGEYLGVSHVAYGEVADNDDYITFENNYAREGIPTLTGRYRMAGYGPSLLSAVKEARTVVVENIATTSILTDIERDYYLNLRVKSLIGVPLNKDGRFVAELVVHNTEPRTWTQEEITLIEEAAERTWAVIEHAKAEEILREQQEQLLRVEKEKRETLEEAMRLKDEFLYLISHEFKTPITVISSVLQSIDTFMTTDITDELAGYLNMIKINTNRQIRLVNNLLDITKINSGNIKNDMSKFDIVHLTRTIIESVEVYALQKKVDLSLTTKVAKKEFYFDVGKFEHIVLNLLSNALKFTPKGKAIKVVLEVEELNNQNFARISVIDEGIGIPVDRQKYIFERFGQADKSLSRQAEGTGLGLYLVKLLVDLLGGEISVKSEVDQGSTFSVLIPIRMQIDLSEASADNDGKPDLNDINNRIIQAARIECSDIYFD